MNILFATSNKNKIKEVEHIWNQHINLLASPVKLDFLDASLGVVLDKEQAEKLDIPDEVGDTYEENSRIKAVHYGTLLNVPVISEDSGLEVEILGNIPGVHTATWNKHKTQTQRNKEIVEMVNMKSITDRQAKYICVLTFYDPARDFIKQFRGEVTGFIAQKPSNGRNGFGFDPIFYFPQLEATFAELTTAQKSLHSHRSKTFIEFIEWYSKNYQKKLEKDTILAESEESEK
ncbi:hypothetical protein ASO20_00800 [Mycoplasma sp. (ex Biomphalaria glabrata)]|uniref:non-canonical purine NTP pyrophosphatase n=1 Tax=Mycoplasma sp. (ex Biomphalaria glabrata) TaxID=1749074 RepID=UPI00073AA436|nr:non-canonical purine NTP pyrophosphatase [Mycoplasma sp. (ex Biomphalaria glabrata)]ALV23215.1 hypothetical protein ASO20_00800 [Mycoplasma sp. (ex Biomphalaria glabrata)]